MTALRISRRRLLQASAGAGLTFLIKPVSAAGLLLQIERGEAKEPWPSARILDDRFIRTFADWAP
jgi:hypothetical protein